MNVFENLTALKHNGFEKVKEYNSDGRYIAVSAKKTVEDKVYKIIGERTEKEILYKVTKNGRVIKKFRGREVIPFLKSQGLI